jgi:hypothetical protein
MNWVSHSKVHNLSHLEDLSKFDGSCASDVAGINLARLKMMDIMYPHIEKLFNKISVKQPSTANRVPVIRHQGTTTSCCRSQAATLDWRVRCKPAIY